MTRFFDTCSLLLAQEDAFKDKFYISNITLKELENIKTSAYKDDSIKYSARQLTKLLQENKEKFEVVVYKPNFIKLYALEDYELNDDLKILACVYNRSVNEDILFITNDLSCQNIAAAFNIKVSSWEQVVEEEYTGYKVLKLTDEELANLYSNIIPRKMPMNDVLVNQYILIQNSYGDIVDKYKWTGEEYKPVTFQKFESKMFGKICPKENDVYQTCAMDSLRSNQVTLLGGPAGSGKTYLALGYLFEQLEKGNIDHIIIFCNPVGARNAARLGFYKGTVREKLLSTQVGHVLCSKLGDMSEVEKLMDDGVLQIIPAVDSRGYEVPPNSGAYILEAQNLTSDLLRLLLQRMAEDTKVIVDGDRKEQLDMAIYESNNGMKSMSSVFKGSDLYGQVDLVNIYRSGVARLAEEMK